MPQHCCLQNPAWAASSSEQRVRLTIQLRAVAPLSERSSPLGILQELTKDVPEGTRIVVCCSGRGDKDVNAAMRYFDIETGEIRDNINELT